jgi:23S rRNA (guanosine2251-2'-O)-methyltransferase
MEKNIKYLGLRAIIEAIQSGATVDKVYIQKEARRNKDLMKVMKREISISPMFQLKTK